MKLQDIIYSDNSYVYSTSHRFCIPFTFAPFTTVGPLDGDMRKAVSFMWHRKNRGDLLFLHSFLVSAVEKFHLDHLYGRAVSAMTFPHTYKGASGSVAALRLMADDTQRRGISFPFDPYVLNCLRSYATTVMPPRRLMQQVRETWGEPTHLG